MPKAPHLTVLDSMAMVLWLPTSSVYCTGGWIDSKSSKKFLNKNKIIFLNTKKNPKILRSQVLGLFDNPRVRETDMCGRRGWLFEQKLFSFVNVSSSVLLHGTEEKFFHFRPWLMIFTLVASRKANWLDNKAFYSSIVGSGLLFKVVCLKCP